MAEHSNTLVTVKSNSSLQTETESQPEATDEEQNEKAFCPTLICESTEHEIPRNLEIIVENLSKNDGLKLNKTDLLICVLFELMIETGFIPKQWQDVFQYENIHFHKDRLFSITNLPDNWKSDSNSYKLEFILQPFPTYICKLSCIQINQNITVNLLLKPHGNFCTNLILNRYISQEDIEPIAHRFLNLNELSITFKNQIALPAKNMILTTVGVPHASLQELPLEILYNIFVEQNALDFVSLKRTCRRMSQSAKYYEHELWKIYFRRDFPQIIGIDGDQWNFQYKTEYTSQRRRRELNRRIRGVKRKPYIFDII